MTTVRIGRYCIDPSKVVAFSDVTWAKDDKSGDVLWGFNIYLEGAHHFRIRNVDEMAARAEWNRLLKAKEERDAGTH